MHLKKLKPADPYLVRNSHEVTKALDEIIPESTTAFSIDIDDLYYNLPHEGIFKAVRELIEGRGEVNFQNQTGINNEQFIELLQFYLQSTVVMHQDHFYVQKSGVCLWSSIAPVLSDIYLRHLINASMGRLKK